jgi:hypothetical protein
MKKLVKGVLFLALGGITLFACTKQDVVLDEPIAALKEADSHWFKISNASTQTVLESSPQYSTTLKGEFLGVQVEGLELSRELVKRFADVSVNFNSSGDVSYTVHREESKNVVFADFEEISAAEFRFSIENSTSEKMFFTINHDETYSFEEYVQTIPSLSTYLNNVEDIDNIDFNDLEYAIPWKRIIKIALADLLDDLLDDDGGPSNHCIQIVQAAIAACAAQNCGTISVGICSVDCTDCGNQ